MTTRLPSNRQNRPMAVLCGLLLLVFLAAGAIKLFSIPFEVSNFAHFGYAPWVMYLIGVVETGGAILLLVPSTRLIGSLLLAAVMVGAATSHLRAGDGFAMATPALVLLALLTVVALANRPLHSGTVGRPIHLS